MRVHRDSMQDAHIVDGPNLAVDRSLKPNSGDIIVAVVNNEFTEFPTYPGRILVLYLNNANQVLRVYKGLSGGI